jgi:hypothetical protein
MNVKDVALRTVKDRRVQIGFAFIAGAAIGSELTFKWSKERHKAAYSALAEEEIAAAKEYYANQRVVQEPKPSTAELIESLDWQKNGGEEHLVEKPTVIKDARLHSVSLDAKPNAFGEGIEVAPPKVGNVFANREPLQPSDDDVWDYDTEQANRDMNPGVPYIIHHDEYFENERDWEQASLTYYEGDDVLADEKDQAIPDPESIVGADCFVRFGYGSKDKNVIYVANDNLEVLFEIVKSSGSYAHEVLGFDDDDENSLKHSNSRNRRFRESDG